MSTNPETFARIGGALKAEHGGNVGWLRVKRGPAFFRRPSEREYLSWKGHSDPTLKAQACAVVVEACFLGVLHDDATELATGPTEFAAVCADEGPAFLDSSVAQTAGDLINRLAGTRSREFGFL